MVKSQSLKRFVLALSIAGLTLSVVGCSSTEDNKNQSSETTIETNKEVSDFEAVEFVYSDGAKNYDVKVTTPRTKAVTLSQFMTEMLLALDLGDQMVGTALLDNPVLPEFEEAYNKIPELEIGEGHAISKEAFLATGADFVSGWDSSISDQTTGTPDELIGILKLNAKKADLVLSEEAEKFAKEFFTKRCENRPANYANGRDVRNFFEKALINQANRLAELETLNDEQLTTLEIEDFNTILL